MTTEVFRALADVAQPVSGARRGDADSVVEHLDGQIDVGSAGDLHAPDARLGGPR